MENKTNTTENVNEFIKEDAPHHEPKSNYVIYTIISVAIFAILYIGGKYLISNLFKDYYMIADRSELSAEELEAVKKYTKIDSDAFSKIRIDRINMQNCITVYYENTDSADKFADNCICYEYGNVVEDIRTEIYPYQNTIPEYVFASSYVNIDDPNVYCLLYSYEDINYAEYHSNVHSSEISAIFMDSEKVYLY